MVASFASDGRKATLSPAATEASGEMAVTTDAERQYVDYECQDQIATIALNRPEKLNAVSDEVVRQLMVAFRRFDADADAQIAILCGRGRAFCSGADVHQRQLRSRGIREARWPPGPWCQFRRLIVSVGELQTGHRRGSRLCTWTWPGHGAGL